MAESDIHVGEGGHKKLDKKILLKRLLVGAGLVVLVAAVAGGAGVGLRWWQVKQEQKRAASPEAIAKEATEAQKLAQSGDLDKAHETINDALGNPGISAQSRHDLYMQQGVTYENQKKYDQATESYSKALAAKETSQAYESLARMAEQKGDKTLAISYYEKAIPLIPEDDAMKDALKKYYENKIIVLKGGEPNYE